MKNATLKQKEYRVVVSEELPTVNECGDIEYGVDQTVLQNHTVTSRAAAVTFMKLWLQKYAAEKPGAVFYAWAREYEYDPIDREWYSVAMTAHYGGDNSKWEWHAH